MRYLPETGLLPLHIVGMEKMDRRTLWKLTEYSLGITDTMALPDAMRANKALAGQVVRKRYNELGCRLKGFFTQKVLPDGSVPWNECGVYKMVVSATDQGRFVSVKHISTAEACGAHAPPAKACEHRWFPCPGHTGVPGCVCYSDLDVSMLLYVWKYALRCGCDFG